MIRPIDLQNTVLSVQNAPAVQRAEEAPRIAAMLAQAQFAAQLVERDESVAPASEVLGSRVDAKADDNSGQDADEHDPREHGFFEQLADDAPEASDEPAHIVDFSA